MEIKKRVDNWLRGWLPKAPELPRPQRRSPVSDHAKVPAKTDLTGIPERRLQRDSGIIIGLGAGLVLTGFLGWLSVNNTYGTLKNFFSAGGLDTNYYLFNRLADQMAIYLSLMSIGGYALLLGALILKSRAAKRLFYGKGPHYRLGGGLVGGGGALALVSTRNLFVYILTSDYLELQLFFVLFLAGVFLLACGLFTLSRGTRNLNQGLP
jgi:hypothetical protein